MTPADRARIAEMLRERLPQWEVVSGRWGVCAVGEYPGLVSIGNDRTWFAWLHADTDQGGPYRGRGWRAALVEEMVAAIQSATTRHGGDDGR